MSYIEKIAFYDDYTNRLFGPISYIFAIDVLQVKLFRKGIKN